MSIFYSVIARNGDVPLAEYDTAAGNYPLIAREILKRVPPEQAIIYSYKEKYNHQFY